VRAAAAPVVSLSVCVDCGWLVAIPFLASNLTAHRRSREKTYMRTCTPTSICSYL
jgi:hypothetical protein